MALKTTVEALSFDDYYAEQPYAPFHDRLASSKEVLVINEDVRGFHEQNGLTIIPEVSDFLRSMMYVPLIVGERIIGHINLNNTEREHAFGEKEVRLVTTVANSMSIALENARLFDETQRLLKETEQRNAELAIKNSVQAGLASKLDMQAMYDLVGDEIRNLFDAQTTIIGSFENETQISSIPYMFEDGQGGSKRRMHCLGIRRHDG